MLDSVLFMYKNRPMKSKGTSKKKVKMGRPRKAKKERRTELVKTLLTGEELDMAQAAADAVGQTMSAWVRGLIIREVKRKEPGSDQSAGPP